MGKYFGKKKLYETLKAKGYKLPKMKEMEYSKYRGSEWLESSSFDERRVRAYAQCGKRITARELLQDMDTGKETEQSLRVYEGDDMNCVFATRYGKVVKYRK